MKKSRCPHCGSTDLRRSRRRGVFDWLLKLVRILPHRCNDCLKRCYKLTR